MEWVEVEASSIEAAVQAALEELGLKSVDEAEVEVLQQPEKGFLGVGRQDAIIRVKPAPKPKKKSRRGRGGQGAGGKGGGGSRGEKPPQKKTQAQGGGKKGGARQGGGKKNGGRKQGGGKDVVREQKGAAASGGRGDSRGGRRGKAPSKPKEAESVRTAESNTEPDDRPPLDAEEQTRVIREFLEGLIAAYGLEGTVETRIEEDIIYADVTGEQTEALVGPKGSILQSILELLKIVVQRKTQHRARIRLDIAGYAERRREALKIYAKRLTEQVLADGGEVMLEPMNPADRKVIHDVVADIEGARSWSEGEEPNRSVIIGVAPGFEPDEGSEDEHGSGNDLPEDDVSADQLEGDASGDDPGADEDPEDDEPDDDEPDDDDDEAEGSEDEVDAGDAPENTHN
jgi:spoIIIJ-associated protein